MRSEVYNSAWEAERKDMMNDEFSVENEEENENDDYQKFLEEEEQKKQLFMKQIGEDDNVDFDHEEISAQNDF
jgi:hypothetical protein